MRRRSSGCSTSRSARRAGTRQASACATARLPLAGLSLVALAGDALVGTVRLWPVLAGRRRALLLGPLAVDPARRDEGIGAALMTEALRRAADTGEESVLLVGDADYYKRFGFVRDLTTGLWLPGPTDRRRFLARELKPRALEKARGPVRKASGVTHALPPHPTLPSRGRGFFFLVERFLSTLTLESPPP